MMIIFKTELLMELKFKYYFKIFQVRNHAIRVTKKLHERNDLRQPIEVLFDIKISFSVTNRYNMNIL